MDYLALVWKLANFHWKLANFHIQDGSHGLICIFKSDVKRERSPVTNIYPIFVNLFLNTIGWIILLEFKNQPIGISKMAAIG